MMKSYLINDSIFSPDIKKKAAFKLYQQMQNLTKCKSEHSQLYKLRPCFLANLNFAYQNLIGSYSMLFFFNNL